MPYWRGFWGTGKQRELYILTGHKSLQPQDAEDFALLAVQTCKSALRTWTPPKMMSLGRLGRIVVSDLLDFLEFFQESQLAHFDPRLIHAAMKQRDKCQRENAVERMDAKHLVRPMPRRGEVDEVGIFHVPEGALDMMLTAVAKDDLFVRKILAISEQNPLAENPLLQFIVGFLIDFEFNPKSLFLANNLSSKKITNILARDDRIQVLLNALLGIGLAFPSGLVAAGDTFLKIAQSAQLLGKMLAYSAELALEQRAASGNDNGALLSEHLFLGAMNSNPFEEGISQVMKPFQRNVQKILMLCRDKGANEMVRGAIQSPDVVFRIVPLIENQGDALTLLFEHLIARHQIVQHSAEGDRIVLVPFVGFGEQRDVKIPGNQQCQADDAKIGAFGFGVSPLGQLARIVRGKEGVKVGGVVKERPQINVKALDQPPRDVIFDLRKNRFVEVVHVVPKALTPQCGSAQREKPDQNRILIPGSKLALARRRKCAIDRGQEQVFANGSPLVPLRGMAVDRADDVQLLSDLPKRSRRSKITLLGVERTPRRLGKPVQKLLRGAKMAHDADSRPAALIAKGFDDAPIALAANAVTLEAWHDSYIQNVL
jgi:hypothetical protein